jgi:outer membrane immunogenic protein
VTHPADSWTGAYVGLIGGYGWATPELNGESTYLAGPSWNGNDPGTVIDNNQKIDATGYFGGAQLGYDWQLNNNLVIGVVGDVAFGDIKGDKCAEDTSIDCSDASASYLSSKINWLGTVRGRVGVAMNNFLVYGTGGLAIAGMSMEYTNNDNLGDNDTAKQTLVGWAAGAGIEYKVTQNLSFGVEYLHADFGSSTYSFTAPSADNFSAKVATTADLVRASLNYRF